MKEGIEKYSLSIKIEKKLVLMKENLFLFKVLLVSKLVIPRYLSPKRGILIFGLILRNNN